MLTVKHRPLTVHDYMQLPEESVKKTELIEGKTLTTPLLPGLKIKVRDVFAP